MRSGFHLSREPDFLVRLTDKAQSKPNLADILPSTERAFRYNGFASGNQPRRSIGALGVTWETCALGTTCAADFATLKVSFPRRTDALSAEKLDDTPDIGLSKNLFSKKLVFCM